MSITTNKPLYGVVDDWVYLYKSMLPKSVKETQLQYQVLDEYGIPHSFYLMEESDDSDVVAIPRYCRYSLELLVNGSLEDRRSDGEDINININVEPRDQYQVDAVNAIINNDHGIICAKTAFGKTYVAINAISKLKKKALILMHKRDLMYQWKEDILKYTDLTDDDVQIFTGSEDKFQKGKPITITTVQNICAKIRNNDTELREIFKNENFGITIFDECHTTIGPDAHSMSTRWVFSKRLYGLSATPRRGDGFDVLIDCLLGKIIYTDDRKMLPVYVTFAPISLNVPINTRFWLQRSDKQYALNYGKWLLKQPEYKKLSSEIIFNLIKENKKILVVAAYKTILEQVYNEVYSILGDNHMDVDRIRMVHGTSESKFDNIKSMDEDQINNFNCIFSTNKFFSEGLSLNWLDTIVYLTSPSSKSLSSIPQLVGRIVREYKGKRFVNVIDIYNEAFDIEVKRKTKRAAAYEMLGYRTLPLLLTPPINPEWYIKNVLSESERMTDILG